VSILTIKLSAGKHGELFAARTVPDMSCPLVAAARRRENDCPSPSVWRLSVTNVGSIVRCRAGAAIVEPTKRDEFARPTRPCELDAFLSPHSRFGTKPSLAGLDRGFHYFQVVRARPLPRTERKLTVTATVLGSCDA
jgi:hypothetical protein